MKKTGVISLLAAAMLASCGGDEAKPTLQGERLTVSVEKTFLQINESARKESFILPEMVDLKAWSQAYGNAAHYTPHVQIEERVRRAWRYGLGGGTSDEATLLHAPVVYGDVVYASNTEGEVYAVSIKDGDNLWDVELEVSEEELLDANPALAVTGEAVYAVFQSGDVYALNPTNGDVLWHKNLGMPLRGAPTLAKTSLTVISQNNSLHVLNQSDGSLQWTHSGLEESLALQGGASVAAHQNTLVVPYSSGELYAMELATGKYLWHDALSFNVGSDPFSNLLDINASPVIANGVLYAVNYNGRFTAFHLETGRRLWSVPMSATKTPLVAGSVIYVVDENGELICLNRKKGLVRWIQDLDNYLDEDVRGEPRSWTGTVLAGNRLFVASTDGYVLTLNPRTGGLDKLADLGDEISIAPIAANGTVLFFTDDARLIAFK